MTALRVGTRGSQLALWQARRVAEAIAGAGGPGCELVVIRTSGDRFAEAPLARIGGKRLFVKEIEEALRRGELDLAVHSAKDLPADLPEELALGAVPPREDPRDAVVLPAGATGPVDLARLPTVLGLAPRIGTSSVRRRAQLRRLLAGAAFEPIRGNLPTRLQKLDAGSYSALVLAAAGLKRLGFADRISLALSADACVPAPGQGAVAVEIRRDDERTRGLVARISDPSSSTALRAERAVVAALGGGCQVPIGALASLAGDRLELVALVSSLDGDRVARAVEHGPAADPEQVGARTAEALLRQGAGEILEEVRQLQAPEGSP